MLSEDPQWEVFLRPTPTIDFNSAIVRAFIRDNRRENDSVTEQVISLYYAVRDRIRYDPYTPGEQPGDYSASRTLEMMRGWCVPKSILYAACCRALGIPARLGYADVRNHLSTENLRRQMGTDIFYWHGYTDVYLNGKWVKATPVFNIELCERFRLKPLEFEGLEDSIYHPFDLDGRQHMEYLNFRGTYADLPFEEMNSDFAKFYPNWQNPAKVADFDREVVLETSA
ncbi:MAG: transglutaminase family protein [Xanthomonadales bacterium]|nr:transglutaminase family protein [Xanthomonadales bacterium]